MKPHYDFKQYAQNSPVRGRRKNYKKLEQEWSKIKLLIFIFKEEITKYKEKIIYSTKS
jgi:hypothetical protein